MFAEDPEIVKYRFCCVTFGITPSQYLLNATVRKHGEKYEAIDPEFTRMVTKHFYIDDSSTGAENVKKAFAACIYIQAITRSGKVQVSFITAKSRVKPIRKKLSIPKLELLGNFVLSKLMKVVYTAFSEEMKIDNYFCWTDSMVTLAWIKAMSGVFKVFV